MTPQQLTEQVEYLSLSLKDLARLTGESEERVLKWTRAEEPPPYWLDVLMNTWAEVPGALDRACEMADAGRFGVE